MQVVVIGGGVVGVCNAYFLAAAGHDVAVLERYSNVAMESSYGHGGLIAPGLCRPFPLPPSLSGKPRRFLSWPSSPQAAAVLIKSKSSRTLSRWLERWHEQSELEQHRRNAHHMQRLAIYGQQLFARLIEHHGLQFEQVRGVLQVLRAPCAQAHVDYLLELLSWAEWPHQLLTSEQAHTLQPALSRHTPLAQALYFPEDQTGNCPLFTRQLRTVLQDLGVAFYFNSKVERILPAARGVALMVDGHEFQADAAVIATGADSLPLLAQIKANLPLVSVKGFSATAFIRNFDAAPTMALQDEHYQVSISRLGRRLRVAGLYEFGQADLSLDEQALSTLVKCAEDWFPDAANYNSASFWSGWRALLPDSVPVLGASPMPGVFLNIGHGSHGWTMAPAAGKIVADLVSGQAPDIDLTGLTLARYG